MNADELPQTSQPDARGDVRVIVVASSGGTPARDCLESVRAHSPPRPAVLGVEDSSNAVNAAIAATAPADVLIVSDPCLVGDGWIERLQASVRVDTNVATASALVDFGGPLAVGPGLPVGPGGPAGDPLGRTPALRPRIERAAGPCVLVRRDAIELVGALDEALALDDALERDFSQRCLLSGLVHVAADDVLVHRLGSDSAEVAAPGEPAALGASAVLARALAASRAPSERLWVTIDARALDGAVTGTQVHILELIRALAATGELRLRLLVRERRVDAGVLELLRGLPETELLSEDLLDAGTPRSTIVHRPQQAFAPEDVAVALRLGERFVLSQLDLIAYRNPGYFDGPAAWRAYQRASRHGMAVAERVVVFSEHTRRELLADALVDDERVAVIPPGIDHGDAGEPAPPAALAGDPQAPFLLCLGTDFRHKNRVFALRLLDSLRRRHGWKGILVLAGTHIPHGSSRGLERELLEQRPELAEAVLELGAVTEQEKAWLLARARAVVYPSVYEGFGLVPFEAALAGTPCLFAATASLAEVAPPGTATIVPWDPDASADAAIALLGDNPERQRHVRTLAQSAAELSWARAARSIVAAYRRAAIAPVREAAVLGRDAIDRERELTAAHMAVVDRLISERRHAQRMYDELNAEVGSGLSLIGPHGALPADAQNALLTISARPALRRALFGSLAALFRGARALSRVLGRGAP